MSCIFPPTSNGRYGAFWQIDAQVQIKAGQDDAFERSPLPSTAGNAASRAPLKAEMYCLGASTVAGFGSTEVNPRPSHPRRFGRRISTLMIAWPCPAADPKALHCERRLAHARESIWPAHWCCQGQHRCSGVVPRIHCAIAAAARITNTALWIERPRIHVGDGTDGETVNQPVLAALASRLDVVSGARMCALVRIQFAVRPAPHCSEPDYSR